jgi:hypothetical protein
VHDGSLYPKARGIKLTGAFTEGAYRALLNIKAKMAADTDLPADFDFCITVLSGPSQNDTDTVSRFPDSGDASAAAAAAAGPAAGSAGSAGVAPHRPPVEKFGMMSGDDYAAFLKVGLLHRSFACWFHCYMAHCACVPVRASSLEGFKP